MNGSTAKNKFDLAAKVVFVVAVVSGSLSGLRLPLLQSSQPLPWLWKKSCLSHFRKQTGGTGEGERTSLILSKELGAVLAPLKSMRVLPWPWIGSGFCVMGGSISKATDAMPY